MLTREEYEAKREARYNRLLAAAEKAEREGTARREQADKMSECIPFGQPILVGHYSEGRDRRFRERIHNNMRKGYELAQKAEAYRSRAEATQGNDAIYSDNPDAVDLLTDKIAKAEAQQALYKAINKAHAAYLKNPASLEKSDLPDEVKETIRNYKPQYSWEPHPIAPYQLTNLSANIRRMKEQAARIEKKQATPDKDETIGDVRIEWRAGENRIRVYYPGRVPLDTYKALKQHGYRPLRSEGEGAFSAYYNNNAAWYVKELRDRSHS